jgi:hypothetical protein
MKAILAVALMVVLTGCASMREMNASVHSFLKTDRAEMDTALAKQSGNRFEKITAAFNEDPTLMFNRHWKEEYALAVCFDLKDCSLLTEYYAAKGRQQQQLIYEEEESFVHNGGTNVYRESDCIGAAIMGECHGSVIAPPVAVCHGDMLNGECIGALIPQ